MTEQAADLTFIKDGPAVAANYTALNQGDRVRLTFGELFTDGEIRFRGAFLMSKTDIAAMAHMILRELEPERIAGAGMPGGSTVRQSSVGRAKRRARA